MITIIKSKKSKKQEDRINLLNSIELFDSLSFETKVVLSDQMKLSQLKAQKTLFAEGQLFDRCLFVLQGQVILTKNSTKKKPIGFEIITRGEPVGVVAVLDNIEMPLTAITLNNCVIAEFNKDTITKLTIEDKAFERNLFRFAVTRFRSVQTLMSQMLASSADERVLNGLKLFVKRSGNSNQRLCEIQLTRRELGILAGVTTETAIRVTKTLEKNGKISLSKRGHILILDEALMGAD